MMEACKVPKDEEVDISAHIEEGKQILANETSEAEVAPPRFNAKFVRRTMLKLDLMLLPIICLMYLFCSLDRSNLGNAKTLGLVRDLGGDPTGSKYALLNSLYYIGYAPFMIPLALLGKRTRVTTVIGISAIYWGTASTCFAAVQNFGQAYVCRFMVGIGEAGFNPLIPFYLARWYSRQQLATRAALWLTMAPLGGFLNGIIAYGVSFIDSHLSPWKVLFLIEGSLTVTMGLCGLCLLPEDIDSARWFNDEEKDFFNYQRSLERSRETANINWKHAWAVFLRWQQLLPPAMYATLQISGAALSAFLPTFLNENGFTGANAQIATLAPYGTAAAVMLACCWASDHYANRGWFVGLGMWLTILSFGMYCGASASRHDIRFAALIIAEVGHYIGTPLVIVWGATNCGSESRRAMTLPLTLATAQAIAIGSGYLFPSPESPRYVKGTAVCLALGVVGALLAFLYQFLIWRENRRRDKREGGRPPAHFLPNTTDDADDAVGFRYEP